MAKPMSTGMDAVHRILSHADVEGDCWEWQGATVSRGYGYVWHDGRAQMATRAIWQLLVGPIPDGYQIDHLCFNPPCVNPDHLRPLSATENSLNRRYQNVENVGRHEREKTHCPYGHPYSGENLIIRKNGKRVCRECQKRWLRDSYRRRKERERSTNQL